MPLQVSVIGCDSEGLNYAKTLNDLGVLNGLYDRDKEVAEDAVNKYGADVRETLKEVYDDESDGVVVASKRMSAVRLCRELLDEDKDVLVTLSAFSSLSDAVQLLKAERGSDSVVMAAFDRAFREESLALRDMVAKYALAEEMENLSIERWSSRTRAGESGDAFRSCLEDIHLARFVTAAEPKRVYSPSWNLRQLHLDLLHGPDFSVEIDHRATLTRGREEILGVSDVFELYWSSEEERVIYRRGETERKKSLRGQSPYLELAREFLDAMRNREAKVATLADAVKAYLTYQLAEASAVSQAAIPISYEMIER